MVNLKSLQNLGKFLLAVFVLAVSFPMVAQEDSSDDGKILQQPAADTGENVSEDTKKEDIEEMVSSALAYLKKASPARDLGLYWAAEVSLKQKSVGDEISTAHLFGLETKGKLKVQQGAYYAVIAPFVGAYADMSLEPRSPIVWGLDHAYVGGSFYPGSEAIFGLRKEDFLGSAVMQYSRSLPTVGLRTDYGSWEGGLWFSTIPYEKQDRPVISREVPYSVALALKRPFNPEYYFMLRSLSLRWLVSENIPSELAEIYGKRGNAVNRGRLANAMDYEMSTLGSSIVMGHKITDRREVEGAFEVLTNVSAPKERSMGLWGELVLRNWFSWRESQRASWWVGGQLYSLGSDVFLAEFSQDYLGYTGIEGQGVVLGYQQGNLEIEGRFRAYQPREENMYKYKTRSFQLALTHHIW